MYHAFFTFSVKYDLGRQTLCFRAWLMAFPAKITPHIFLYPPPKGHNWPLSTVPDPYGFLAVYFCKFTKDL